MGDFELSALFKSLEKSPLEIDLGKRDCASVGLDWFKLAECCLCLVLAPMKSSLCELANDLVPEDEPPVIVVSVATIVVCLALGDIELNAFLLGEKECLGLSKVTAVFVSSSLSLLLALATASVVLLKELVIGLVFLEALATQDLVLIGLDFLEALATEDGVLIGLAFLALATEDGVLIGLAFLALATEDGVLIGLVFIEALATEDGVLIGLVFLEALATEDGVLIGLDFLGGVFTGLVFLAEIASSHFFWLYMDGL